MVVKWKQRHGWSGQALPKNNNKTLFFSFSFNSQGLPSFGLVNNGPQMVLRIVCSSIDILVWGASHSCLEQCTLEICAVADPKSMLKRDWKVTRCPLGCTKCCFNQAPVLGQQRDPARGRYSRDANKTALNSVCNSFPLLTSSPPLHSPLPHIPKSWANILSCFSHSKALTQENSRLYTSLWQGSV